MALAQVVLTTESFSTKNCITSLLPLKVCIIRAPQIPYVSLTTMKARKVDDLSQIDVLNPPITFNFQKTRIDIWGNRSKP